MVAAVFYYPWPIQQKVDKLAWKPRSLPGSCLLGARWKDRTSPVVSGLEDAQGYKIRNCYRRAGAKYSGRHSHVVITTSDCIAFLKGNEILFFIGNAEDLISEFKINQYLHPLFAEGDFHRVPNCADAEDRPHV